jgi:hypothetical protein
MYTCYMWFNILFLQGVDSIIECSGISWLKESQIPHG